MRVCAAGVIGGVALAAGSVHGAIVDVVYTGTVTSIQNEARLPAELQGLGAGDRWEFSYTVDTDAVTIHPTFLNPGIFNGDGTSNAQLTFTSGLSTISDGGTMTRVYADDSASGAADQVGAWASNMFGGGTSLWRVWTVTEGLIDSDGVPTDLSTTGPFSGVFVQGLFGGGETQGVVNGDLASMSYVVSDIPAPGAGVFVGVGGLMAVRRRRT